MFSILYEKDGVSRIFLQNFRLTVSKNFVGEQFSVSESFDSRKKFLHEKGRSRLCFEKFCFTVPKNFIGEIFVLQKILVSKFFMHRRGRGHHVFASNFMSQRTEKHLKGVPFVSQNF